ncbi:MAG TPA: DUF2235 domain-containing protein [Candidatus Methylacidiphilales bacterium]
MSNTAAKNIVLLSDGTGNSAKAVFKTNVWRLFQLLDLRDPSRQIAFYDDGVGTSSFKLFAALGGIFGFGLKRNVIAIYSFCCRNYVAGDRIYCFGFSRGAFTIRIVAAMIAGQGLVAYNNNEADLARFAEGNPDLQIFGPPPAPEGAEGEAPAPAAKEKKDDKPRRRFIHVELHESKAVADILHRLAQKGLDVEHYSAQDKPLYEIHEGSGDNQKRKPLFSIPEILDAIKEVGRNGLEIKRFKGLGEMNPKQLFETTMDPQKRRLLKVDIADAIEAEDIFTKLMGDEVEPRRRFIEDNALNVRNLDI